MAEPSPIRASTGRSGQASFTPIAQFKPQLEQVEAFRRKKGELEKKIEVIDGLDHARRGPVRVMAELADRIPDRVYLKSVETSGTTIKIQGESVDNELVALFLRSLAESEYFDDIDLEGTKLSAGKTGFKNVQFDVKAALVSPKPEASVAPAGQRGAGAKGAGAKARSAAAAAPGAKG